ncbi:MAG: helix-turn-helix transcriptional regulator [Oscillospiraceae bacterium]|nr:helix-turn-helix transcriptional regulator [Oscillospiraceae bacterium]
MKEHLLLYPNLVSVRKAKCTQKELAEYLGISQQEISRYERGEVKASIGYLRDVADYCNVSVDYILGRESKCQALLNEDEMQLLSIYELLTPENKAKLTERAQSLFDMQG